MKHLILFALFIVMVTGVYSQAVEGRVEYQKTTFRAAVLEVPYPPEQVSDAFDNYMKSKGSPGTPVKGYKLYRNVKISEKENFYGDMYVGVEKKSRKEKEASAISIIVGRPNEIITSRSADDDYGLAESKVFLNKMVAEVQSHNVGVEITKQEEATKKAEKKYADLQRDSTDLSKRLQEINDKISKNSATLQQQRLEIEKEKQTLETIKSRKN